MNNLTMRFTLLDEISSKLESIASQGQAVLAQFDNIENSADGAFANMSSSVTSAAGSVGTVISPLDQASSAAAGLAAAANQVTDESEELSDALEETSSETADYADNTEEAGNAMEGLSAIMTSAGIAAMLKEIAGAYMEASEAAAEYEVAVKKIETIADTEAASMAQIQSDISALSEETGRGVNDLSEATYQAISASVDTANAVSFTATATKLAEGGFTSAATSVDVLTTALNAYGLEASQAESIADMMVTTQNLGKTSVDLLANSVGRVIPLAAAYGVNMENLSAGYAELTKGGIATAESTTYLRSMLNELGKSTSDVAVALSEETGKSFAQLMAEGYSLGDVLEILGDSVNGDTTAFNELWSSQEAGIGALALYNAGAAQFNTTLAAMENSAGATEQAYQTMTDTTTHAHELMTNASENLAIAVGDDLNPVLRELYGLGESAFNWMGDIVEKYPGVTAAITGLTAGAGSVTTAVVAYTAATKIATLAAGVFGTTVAAAAGPLLIAGAAIAAVTAAVVYFANTQEDVKEEVLSMTATTAAQTEELENLKAEYNEAVEIYGEYSEEASRLRYEIDDLSAEIDANGESVSEMAARYDNIIASHDELIESFAGTSEAINEEELNNLALIQKLDDLANASGTAGSSQKAMEVIINSLNGSIAGLNLTYEDLVSNQEETIESIRAAARAQAEQQKNQALYEEWVALLGEVDTQYTAIQESEANLNAETERASDAQAAYNELLQQFIEADMYGEGASSGLAVYFSKERAALDGANEAVEIAQQKHDELNSTYEETTSRIEEIEKELGLTKDSQNDLTNETMTYEEAAATAYQAVQTNIEELAKAYDEAYEAAQDSFEGQFSLFDEADMKSKEYVNATISNAQEALNSQLSYWSEYSTNLDTIKNTTAEALNITQEQYDALVAEISDGSTEAAGLAANIADAITNGKTEAITELAETMSSIEEHQNAAAATTADWQTDFSEQMQQYATQMETIITDDLNLKDEAATAATNTVNSYIAAIKAGESGAVAAAQSIARKVTLAFESADTTVNVGTSVPGHAEGTTNAENVFVAGENGPELIVGKSGSTVFPAEETQKIIDAISGVYVPGSYDYSRNTNQTFETVNSYDYSRNMNQAFETASSYDYSRNMNQAFETANSYDYSRNTSQALETTNNYITQDFPVDEANSIIAAMLEANHADASGAIKETSEQILPAEETQKIIDAISGMYTSSSYDYSKNTNQTFETANSYITQDFPVDEANSIIAAMLEANHADTSETVLSSPEENSERILPAETAADLEAKSLYVEPAEASQNISEKLVEKSARAESKKITIEVAGSGAINVTGGANKDQILALLYENIKPVLANIIQTEAFEEARLSYDY